MLLIGWLIVVVEVVIILKIELICRWFYRKSNFRLIKVAIKMSMLREGGTLWELEISMNIE